MTQTHDKKHHEAKQESTKPQGAQQGKGEIKLTPEQKLHNDRVSTEKNPNQSGGPQQVFPGFYRIAGKLSTKNANPGVAVYGEPLVKQNGIEYRMWDPKRSKLAAAIVKGAKHMPIKQGANVLYLGAANGTTPSHVSDVIGKEGIEYCVEISARAMRDLVLLCEQRANMYPILGDARQPSTYENMVGKVDVVYADVADREQTQALLRNAQHFKAKYVMIAIKARCIDSIENPRTIYQQEKAKIEQFAKVLDFVILDPFEVDHCFITAEMK